ncbi:MAG: phosphatidylglycerophosphatase A [Rhodospirillaceae bacterium]
MKKSPEISSDSPRKLIFHPAGMIATCVGIGFLPVAPGTWASLAALPVAWIIVVNLGQLGLAIAAAGALLAGIWAGGRIETLQEEKDPSAVVIDEVAGQWVALLAVPPDFVLYAIGFGLFRLADIFKPWPVSWAEGLPGGFGVMMDDVLAGIYAGLGVYVISVWLKV